MPLHQIKIYLLLKKFVLCQASGLGEWLNWSTFGDFFDIQLNSYLQGDICFYYDSCNIQSPFFFINNRSTDSHIETKIDFISQSQTTIVLSSLILHFVHPEPAKYSLLVNWLDNISRTKSNYQFLVAKVLDCLDQSTLARNFNEIVH